MKKYIFAILLIIPFLTDAQNRNNTLKSWVYYELLSIDAKIAEGRFARRKIILRWLMNTGHQNLLIMQSFLKIMVSS